MKKRRKHKAPAPAAVTEAEIEITAMGRRGDGTGRWQDQPVFVPRALPGERVRVAITTTRDRGWRGQILEIISPAADRTAPPCPYYEDCGGCTLQHWAPESYQSWKKDQVKTMLARAGLEPERWEAPVFIPHATRRRTTLTAFVQNKSLRLGYRRARSHDITDIPDCLALSPAVQDMASRLRPYLAQLLTDSRPATIFIQESGAGTEVLITGALGARRTPGLAERELMGDMARACAIGRLSWRAQDKDAPEIILQPGRMIKQSGELAVELPPGAFLQPSAAGEAALVKALQDAVAPLRAKKGGKLAMADLFAGCGTFTGPLLEYGAVHAAEGDQAATEALRAAGAGRADLSIERRNLFAEPLSALELARFDAVVIDPPRAGAKEQAAVLADSAVKLVAAISCNPASFTRDAALLAAGGYRLASVQIIDQFIWSSHTELVAIFHR